MVSVRFKFWLDWYWCLYCIVLHFTDRQRRKLGFYYRLERWFDFVAIEVAIAGVVSSQKSQKIPDRIVECGLLYETLTKSAAP